MRLLASHGVRELWLVDPDAETIEIYALHGKEFVVAGIASGAEPVRSLLLPDLSLTAQF